MKKVLIISFDIIRDGECEISYSIASLIAYVKAKNSNSNLSISHISFNMRSEDISKQLHHELFSSQDILKFDSIAISNYVWSDEIVKKLISGLRKFNFEKNIILGGSQITYSEDLPKEYPECKIFISGFGEESLFKAINLEKIITEPIIFNSLIDYSNLPSPYLSGEMKIAQNQRMVRMETKRGCPYRCNFCAHRDLENNNIYEFELARIYKELDLFKLNNVKKINVIDPIFNTGKQYLDVLKYMVKINLKSQISLQARFEMITGKKGDQFIELCKELDIVLEFGLQTTIESESKAINRKNNLNYIRCVVDTLNNNEINFEVNLIYGLPDQTINSFVKSINYLKSINCKNITAHHLMLLKGTELFAQKEKWEFKEKIIGKYKIPLLIESKSLSESYWYEMHHIAITLNEKP